MRNREALCAESTNGVHPAPQTFWIDAVEPGEGQNWQAVSATKDHVPM